ncbi:MAG TPA: hypothetical protein VHB68_03395 [Steroidobacteraceae bacterium]|nr:hypothetical protein [Steroidobacteraceae bacterium]
MSAIMRRVGCIEAGLVALAATAAAVAGPAPAAGPPLAPRTHGFMLYFSQPLGGGAGAARPRLGLRIEQVRMTGNSGAPDAGDPLQHRELIGWQMEGLRHFSASGMKVELGGRVTYDVAHGAFGPQRWLGNTSPRQTSTMSRMGPPLNRMGEPADLLIERYPALRNLSPQFAAERGGAVRESYGDTAESAASMRDAALAAVATLRLPHPGLVQRLGAGRGQRPLSMPLRGEAR